jgi:hypothetical protein
MDYIIQKFTTLFLILYTYTMLRLTCFVVRTIIDSIAIY